MYALAEQTYHFGFVNIALGHMVQRCLRVEAGLDCEFVPFGCDTSLYCVNRRVGRKGVVFYARPSVDRRGYDLAVLALMDFAGRHPDHPIHLYGGHDVRLPFPVVRHGRLTPTQLNDLYNQSVAGLALSFTNISLVAEEMLAAGVVPIVNDSPLARADMPSSAVLWATPTPNGISNALSEAVANHSNEIPDRVAATARSGWASSQKAFTTIVERSVRGYG